MVSGLINQYPNTFAVVEYHVQDAYATPWGEARGVFYNIWGDGVPWFAYDGLFDAWPINTYQSKFIQRQAVPTPVTLTVEMALVSGENYQATLRACLETGANPLTLRAYAVIVEDYYPTSPNYSRNTFRVAADTVDIHLVPGECTIVQRSFTLDPQWIKDNLQVIAWVQVPNAGIPAEVYQAAKDPWPWGPAVRKGDVNCDGFVDFGDINPFVLLLTNPSAWQAAYPGCPLLNGDINEDGIVDFADINPFVRLLTNP